jgi:hypothetical protein
VEEIRSGEWLDAELARRVDAVRRMAGSLVELDRHPGHRLLAGHPVTGRTAQRWTAATATLAGLWRDFAAFRDVVEAAERVRGRRVRPGERELAELHRLLVTRSVEVGRSSVALSERGLTGDAERVETLSPAELATRMETAFAEVSTLVDRCDALHSAYLAGLAPRIERVAAARRLVTELGLTPADPDAAAVVALTARIDALGAAAAADPLALDGDPPGTVLAGLDRDITAAVAGLEAFRTLRSGWEERLRALSAALHRLDGLRGDAERAHARATELVVGGTAALPANRLPELRSALDRLRVTHGWRERAATERALCRAVDDAGAELRAAHELAEGLLERRAELRGRFGAYRAKAARLRRAEETELLTLDADIERLLWSRPADLAAATRALAAYRRRLESVS